MHGILDITETEASSPRLELLGLESQNFLLNGGTLFIFFTLWFTALLLSYLLTALLRLKNDLSKLQRFVNWLDRQLKWNSFFNLIFTSQVELLLSSIIQLKHWQVSLNGDQVACIFAILTLLLYTVVPFVQLRIILTNNRLSKEVF